MTFRKCIVILAVCLGSALSAAAQTQVGFQAEYFRWREFDSDGTRLLEEEDALPGIFIRHDRKITGPVGLHAALAAFSGTVHYEGGIITEDGGIIPIEARTRYTGVRADVDLSVSADLGPATIRPFAGLGAWYWLREIGRFTIQGYDEYWFMPYGRAGLGVSVPLQEPFRAFASMSVRIPFDNQERVEGVEEADTIEIEPGEEIGYEAEIGLQFRRAVVSVYWLFQEFDESDYDDSGQFLQPESEQLSVGVRLGLAF